VSCLPAPLVTPDVVLSVTGIPPTGAQAVESRGGDDRRHRRTTSPFVPWPSREDAEQEA
jgi:hypothetical protein